MGQRQWGLRPETMPCACRDFVPLPRRFEGSFAPATLVRQEPGQRLGLEKVFAFESERQFRALVAAVQELGAAPPGPYLQPLAASVRDGGFCGVSSLCAVFEHFDHTLEDLVRERREQAALGRESRVWALLFDAAEALAHEKQRKTRNNYLHPRSLAFCAARGRWLLLHHRLFVEDNFALAFADLQAQFCSPELYAQTLNRDRQFYLSDFDASNVFSLAVAVAWALLGEQREQLRAVFARETASVDVRRLQQLLGELPRRGYSALLARVLADMSEELGYRRLGSAKLAKLLGAFRPLLTADDFDDHTRLLQTYAQEKALEDDQSMHVKLERAYAGDFDEMQQSELNAITPKHLDELIAHTAPFRTYEEIFF